jgi:sugar lactone lactonase YvrE
MSCSNSRDLNTISSSSDTLALITERDLIPEGTAYDPKNNRVFISSMYKRKIIAIEQSGKYYDFIETGADDLWSVFGMEVDTLRNKLWVISTKGNSIPTYPAILDDRWQSRLYCYDLTSKKLIEIYKVNAKITDALGFNDLTVAKNGDVYITESLNSKVYVLKNGTLTIVEFIQPNAFTFLNGITLSNDNETLFVASTEGLLRIDVKTKTYKVLKSEFTTVPGPIDGLTFFKNSLIAHQGTLIRRLYLNSVLDSIVGQKVVDDQNLNSSTTGEIGEDGWYYYIANSQIRSGVDYSSKRVRSLDSLQNVLIKKRKLTTDIDFLHINNR